MQDFSQNPIGNKPEITRKVLPGTDKDRGTPDRIYIAIMLSDLQWKMVSDKFGRARVFPSRRVARNFIRNNMRGFASFCELVPAIATDKRYRVD